VCIAAHTSSATFAIDESLGRWSVLVDLSSAGSTVVPTPGGVADANKFLVTTPTGTGYTIDDVNTVLALLGTTTVGKAVLQAASAGAARSAIDAQVSGSYQAGDATLTALSGASTNAFGIALLALANAAGLRSAAGLGTAATLDAGTALNNLVQMAAGPKLPAVDGSALTNLTIPYPTLTSSTNTLGSDVVCVNTTLYYDGPSLNIGATGTWLVIAKLCVGLPGSASSFYLKLTDGTTLIDSANMSIETSTLRPITLAGIITNPAGNVKAQVRNATVTNGGFVYNNSGLGKDCQLFAVRIA